MNWPTSQDYNEAVQDPATNFSDPALRRGEVAVNSLGLPITRSGTFADVYQFTDGDGKVWALKCFTRKVAGLKERYARIDEHLAQARLRFTVGFRFLEEGIRVRGEWYPLLKMEWVEGFTLNDFVARNLDKPHHLHALMQLWAKLAGRLRDANMAHADLQHGNVLLVPGATPQKLGLKLIDYDGMWVSALAGYHSGEVGHPNFQHPTRLKEKLYNGDVDRFPHLVIAAALRATLIGGKALWDKFDNEDNLLFKEADFRDPAKAPVFKTLWELNDPVLRTLVGHIALSTKQPLRKAPWLDDVLFEKGGPKLSRDQERQVCELFHVRAGASTGVPTALPVDKEFNEFAFWEDQEAPQPQSKPTARRTPARGKVSPHKTKLVPLVGAGLAVLCLGVGLAIGMRGPSGSTGPVASTTSKKTDSVDPPLESQPWNPLARVINGSWRAEKTDLVQDHVDDPARLYFDLPKAVRESDFDLDLTIEKCDEPDGVAVAIGADESGHGCVFTFGMEDGRPRPREIGLEKMDFVRGPRSLPFQRMCKLKIEVRSGTPRCKFDGQWLAGPNSVVGPDRIGLLTWCRAKFKSIRVTRLAGGKAKTLWDVHPVLPDVPKASPTGRESWVKDDEELVQTSHLPDVHLVFGDKSWRDYDFTFEAKKVSGGEGFGPLFRVRGNDDLYLTIFGGWCNTSHGLQDAKTGRQGERLDRRVPGYVHIGQWYAVKLSVRGDRATCKLDGIDVFHDAPIENPTGGVGLRTSRTAARFRNLMVTDPAGRVLFREVPDPKRCQGFRTLVPIGLDHEVRWRYTTDEPGTDWRSPEFDDSAWKEGLSAFAKHSVQTGVARTIWRQPDIWIRHTFETTSEAPALELLLRHDDDIDVYIDGRLAFRETGAIQEYKRVPVLRAARESLKAGTHVIAVHCHDYGGLAFVDVGVQESLTSNP